MLPAGEPALPVDKVGEPFVDCDDIADVVVAALTDEIAGLLAALFSVVLDGRNESLADGVQRALGRQPKDFADFARRAAAKGAWRQAA